VLSQPSLQRSLAFLLGNKLGSVVVLGPVQLMGLFDQVCVV
jgi:hypothetical protein